MRYVNLAKYTAARMRGSHTFWQPHALFHFLLDYFDWDKPFGPGGLIQYQSFIPAGQAEAALGAMLRLSRRRGFPNYLSVLKRHRPDDFLISYGLDGYSLAMDFRVTAKNRARLLALTHEMDEIVLGANGRFYLAKDSTLRPAVVEAYLGQDVIARLRALKRRCDPESLLQSDLWRRLFEATRYA